MAEERWQPLLRQRDDAQRERARAARALSAAHAEKRELEWAVSDLGRRGGRVPLLPSRSSSTAPYDALAPSPPGAWEAPRPTAANVSALAAADRAGLAVTPHPPRTASFHSSPYGRGFQGQPPTSATTPAAAAAVAPDAWTELYGRPSASSPRASPTDARAAAEYASRPRTVITEAWSDLSLRAVEAHIPGALLPTAADAYRAKLEEAMATQQLAAQHAAATSSHAGRGGSDMGMWASMEDLDPWAALAQTNSELQKRLEAERSGINLQHDAERAAASVLEQRLEFERAAAAVANPNSTPWTFV